MKVFSTLVVAGCLVCAAPLAQACPSSQHGAHQGPCVAELDTDKDGAVSQVEFNAFHAARFQEMDANKDGKLTEDEMESKMEAKHHGMTEIHQDPFDKRFDEVDINHDGGLSKAEAEIGMPMLFKRFDEIDANKDGKMTKQEVVESMQKMHSKMHGSHGEAKPKPAK
ncbi:MAG: EF-hand domain-containing protein [Sideroxydans sp.]|nr:EF-hand domain-containing protein [Sideroxydans sp.]NOT98710.1 EF-hand domain-containing protein [Sideroxydans sp.]